MRNGNLVLVCDTDKEPEMHQLTLHYLGKMGYKFAGGSRNYRSVTPGLEIMLVRGIDIPEVVACDDNFVDVGVCSGPVIREAGKNSLEKLDLPYGDKEFIVYANEQNSKLLKPPLRDNKETWARKLKLNGRADERATVIVYTSWPETSSRYCASWEFPAVLTNISSGPNPIIDTTPNAIGMEYMSPHELWENHVYLDKEKSPKGAIIVSPHSYKGNPDRIDGFLHRFKMALKSDGMKLFKFNVPEGDLEKVREYLPAMKGPTYSKLLKEGWYGVETALPIDQIERAMTALKRNTGAEGFLELEVNGVEL